MTDLGEQTFPMRVVTRMTGLTADVVRVWERRHSAISPARTDGNARRYSSHDIERLTCLRDAIAAGHSIGGIAQLSNAELRALSEPANGPAPTSPTIEQYLDAMSRFDSMRGEALLARASQMLGARAFVLEIALPLMREVGDRWHAGVVTVAEEHAMTAQLRSHLATLLRTTVVPAGAMRIVFATPPTYRHDMGAMMAAVVAATHGVSAVYLGADLPFEEMLLACERTRAKIVVLSMITSPTDAATRRREEREIVKLAARVEVWIGAPAGHFALDCRGVRPMTDFFALEALLHHRRAGGAAGSAGE